MYLYKYRELEDNDGESFKRLQSILQRQAFWCARPDTLNDDQEFSWHCDYIHTDETLEFLAKLMNEELSWPYERAQEQLKSLLASSSLERLAAPVVASLIEQCRSEIGLLCFGTSPNNSTLWSRYGGDGNGVCIELKVPDQLIDKNLFWVDYTDQKVVHINTLLRSHFGDAREMYRHALLTKPQKWAPEEEVRFISKTQGVSVRIEDSHLSRIYFGSRLSETARMNITSILEALPHRVISHDQPRA
jgi:hypothetical protein